jgi:hypothetical protein
MGKKIELYVKGRGLPDPWSCYRPESSENGAQSLFPDGKRWSGTAKRVPIGRCHGKLSVLAGKTGNAVLIPAARVTLEKGSQTAPLRHLTLVCAIAVAVKGTGISRACGEPPKSCQTTRMGRRLVETCLLTFLEKKPHLVDRMEETGSYWG